MEKLCGTASGAPQEGSTFFRRICGLFRHRVKEKIYSPENTETPGENIETDLNEESTIPQTDKQSVKTQPKLTVKEKYERRKARRAERRREVERAKSDQIVTKNGIRLLTEDTDIIQEMTGEIIVGAEPPIHEAILEKETDISAKPDPKITINNIKIRLQKLEQDELLRIDLHGNTRGEIKPIIDGIIRDGKNSNEKFVLIITGWGKGSQNGEAKLKPDTQKILRDKRKKGEIKDFMEAPNNLGGEGAFVVVLR